ncbi:MAG: DUF5665 domain-containing protein [Patescibacteria group bacterium]
MNNLDPKKLDELIKLQEKQVSLRWNFYRGIIYGFGFFVGSVLLIGAVIYILSFINTIPMIGEFTSQIIDFIESQQGI